MTDNETTRYWCRFGPHVSPEEQQEQQQQQQCWWRQKSKWSGLGGLGKHQGRRKLGRQDGKNPPLLSPRSRDAVTAQG